MTKTRLRLSMLWTALALGGTTVAGAQEIVGASPWELSGYYLSLYTRSRTIVPALERFDLDLIRLRLRLETKLAKNAALDLQYDNELLLGNYIRTTQYSLAKQRVPATSWDLEHEYASARQLVARHRIYRATVTWSGRSTDVKVGRQRIPLGTGFFWSPTDLLNPVDPTRLERDYRAGADGILVQQRLGALARVDAMYVPATSRLESVTAGYLHGNTRGVDYSILAGDFRGNAALGTDFAFSTGGLGIRGEATGTRSAEDERYVRVLLGGDYGFENSLTLTAEAYYNGQGAADPASYDMPALLAGRVLNVARFYAAIAASYELTPLYKVAGYAVLNVDDGSLVLWPRLEWSATSNSNLAVGSQWFGGDARSEYGRFSNVLHAEARLFF